MKGDGSGEALHLTVEEHEARLKELIRAADAADLDFEGEFIVGDPTDDTYWNIEITKYARSGDGDGDDG